MGFLFGDGSAKIYKKARKEQEQLWYQGMQSGNEEAGLLEEQGRIALQEAEADAQLKREEGAAVMGEQSVAYLNSGVTLEGTPLAKLAETKYRTDREIDAIMSRGMAINDLYKRRAGITRNEARSAILGSMSDFGIQEARAKNAERRAIINPLIDVGRSFFSAALGGM